MWFYVILMVLHLCYTYGFSVMFFGHVYSWFYRYVVLTVFRLCYTHGVMGMVFRLFCTYGLSVPVELQPVALLHELEDGRVTDVEDGRHQVGERDGAAVLSAVQLLRLVVREAVERARGHRAHQDLVQTRQPFTQLLCQTNSNSISQHRKY